MYHVPPSYPILTMLGALLVCIFCYKLLQCHPILRCCFVMFFRVNHTHIYNFFFLMFNCVFFCRLVGFFPWWVVLLNRGGRGVWYRCCRKWIDIPPHLLIYECLYFFFSWGEENFNFTAALCFFVRENGGFYF